MIFDLSLVIGIDTPTAFCGDVAGELVEGIDRAGMRVSDDVGDGDERSNRIRVSNSSFNQS